VDLSQLTPTVALLAVFVLCLVDLGAGFLASVRNRETTVSKLPEWLVTNLLHHFAPTALVWLTQLQQPVGTFSSQALAVGVYTAAITSAPKLAQDVVRKLGELLGR
jgi:hypothetical protein